MIDIQQIKIFQLLDSSSIGGIETHVIKLAQWLNEHQYQCEVIFIRRYGSHPLTAQLKKLNIKYRYLNNIFSLLPLLRQQPSLLATHGYKAGILGRVMAKLCQTPVVSTYHSGDMGTGKLRLYSLLDDSSASLANKVISVSNEISLRLNTETKHIPNFIYRKFPTGSPFFNTKHKEIAFVGRLSHEKGPDIFAKISTTLVAKNTFTCYGDGPLKNSLQSKHPQIHFKGHCDMLKHWNNIGLLCITSRFEGLPFVALEAMSHGIPVISFKLGGLEELIKHNTNGWLIDRDDIEAFRITIKYWQSMSAYQKLRISDAARKQVNEHYSCDCLIPKIITVYHSAVLDHLAHGEPNV
ncbi:MAG: glycosyltransferase family 4 protein [Oceanospirillaceae bacterium]|nr:glycosyltransferase family 4 protein [Oceanospirillaceae bacterium]